MGEASGIGRADLVGIAASPGVAVGPAHPVRIAEIHVAFEHTADPTAEKARLREALARVRAEVARTRDEVRERAGAEEAAIFDAHIMMLNDPVLVGSAEEAIDSERLSAPAALQRAAAPILARYERIGDAYLRARAVDVASLIRQVLAALGVAPAFELRPDEPVVIVAQDLGPAEVARMDPQRVVAFATAAGSETSHAAIVARSLRIPAVVGLGDVVLRVTRGTPLLVDGDAGRVWVDPRPDIVSASQRQRRVRQEVWEQARVRAGERASTQDGTVIGVYANAGSIEGVRSAVEYGADGIGLLRTEFLFLGRSLPPDEEEQVAAYRAILDAASGPVTFRTLDAGGDKPLPYLDLGEEANPFLGLRGIRALLDRPDLLRTQLRAILRAAAGRPVRIMFPMIAELDELRRALRILDDAASGLGWPTRAEVGTMVEVPSAALLSTHLAEEVAFFSIGTNDLVQYTLAAERGNPRVAALADPLHPSVLRLIQMVCDAGRARGRSVSVCGEAAADPDAIPLLIGMGVGELSVAGPAVPVVKEAVRAVRITDARDLAAEALRAASAQEVRNLVSAWRAHSLRSPIPSAPKAADPGFR